MLCLPSINIDNVDVVVRVDGVGVGVVGDHANI
jgi:hypothetical protein